MSQKTQKIRLLSNCSVSTDITEDVAVVIAASCDGSKKKKEAASETLYLARI